MSMKKIIADRATASSTAAQASRQAMPRRRATTAVAQAPMAPASDGVNSPP